MNAQYDHTALLLAYLDGVLDAPTHANVVRRLTQDRALQQQLEHLQRRRKDIATTLDATDLVVQLQPQVWQQITRRTVQRRVALRRGPGGSPILVACLSILLIGFIVLLAVEWRRTQTDGNRGTQAQPLLDATATAAWSATETAGALAEQMQLTATAQADHHQPTLTAVGSPIPTIPPATATALEEQLMQTATALAIQGHPFTPTVVEPTIPPATETAAALIGPTGLTATALIIQQQQPTATFIPTIPPATATVTVLQEQLPTIPRATATALANEQLTTTSVLLTVTANAVAQPADASPAQGTPTPVPSAAPTATLVH